MSKIYLIRNKKVMLDKDLAQLYKVDTRSLNQAVKRNIGRFPEDFMFRLNSLESELVVSQSVIPSKKFFGGSQPYVFTEQGVAMLSSVLRSDMAVQVNIQIIRTFTKLREILAENKTLAERLDQLELKYNKDISKIFKVLRYLVKEEEKPKEKLGFSTTV